MRRCESLFSSAALLLLLSFICTASAAAPAVCREWIKPFWDTMVLHEDRPAVFEDLERYFIFIDMDGNGKVSSGEFWSSWHDLTLMGAGDTGVIFSDWSHLADTSEPDYIIDPNVTGLWTNIADGSDYITEQEFTAWWTEELKKLPQHGCPA